MRSRTADTRTDDTEMRCPVCGRGVVRDIAFDAGVRGDDGRPKQDPKALQLVTYSCGHEAAGPRLETADADRLAVERRTTEETVDPAPGRERPTVS